MPQPTQIQIVTRQPACKGDPGTVVVGYYLFHDGLVTLTDARGEPLPGGWSRELKEGDDPHTVAKCIFREQRLSGRNWLNDFRRPLPPVGPLV
jgi:hypothetical protein